MSNIPECPNLNLKKKKAIRFLNYLRRYSRKIHPSNILGGAKNLCQCIAESHRHEFIKRELISINKI